VREDLQQLLNILQSNVDINSCLLNCSNQGICKLDPQIQKYICECYENFMGKSCQTDKRPCSQSNKCLNNGTCVNSQDLTSFSCQCPERSPFYGQYCENVRNLCENVTCSSHGYCTHIQSEIKCKCFDGYEGVECEKESNKVKVVRNVQWTSTIICIICILIFWSLMIGSDVLEFYKIGTKRSTKHKNQKLKYRFHYHTWPSQ
jgi:hypothetical protein